MVIVRQGLNRVYKVCQCTLHVGFNNFWLYYVATALITALLSHSWFKIPKTALNIFIMTNSFQVACHPHNKCTVPSNLKSNITMCSKLTFWIVLLIERREWLGDISHNSVASKLTSVFTADLVFDLHDWCRGCAMLSVLKRRQRRPWLKFYVAGFRDAGVFVRFCR